MSLEPDVPHDVVATVELLVSELATNSVLHANSPFSVDVAVRPDAVHVEVHDETPALPVVRDVEAMSSTGRGLQIVEALADRWGTDPTPWGKRVWFECDRTR